jgi:nucleoside-diphosphate-sugar epimerase
MKVILFGATGMVGKGVLRQCLLDAGVEAVLSIGRSPSGVSHPKLRDLVRPDMFDFNVDPNELSGYDTCFFCLGVSSVRMSEAEYRRLTYDLTMGWAYTLARVNPAMRFLYVSGMGTGGKSMWARVKGRTENDLLALFPEAIMIRLGALRPMHGERSKAPGGSVLLTILSPFWPLLQRLWPRGIITTEELGRAMIVAARTGVGKRVLESADLVSLVR